jgi:hypothetical protein
VTLKAELGSQADLMDISGKKMVPPPVKKHKKHHHEESLDY